MVMPNPVLLWLVAWIEDKFPGSKIYIDYCLDHIDQAKLASLIMQAIHDYQLGMSFIDILKDLLSQNLPQGVTLPE